MAQLCFAAKQEFKDHHWHDLLKNCLRHMVLRWPNYHRTRHRRHRFQDAPHPSSSGPYAKYCHQNGDRRNPFRTRLHVQNALPLTTVDLKAMHMQPRCHCTRSNRSMNSDELPTQGMGIMSIEVPSNPQDSRMAYAASAVTAGFSFTSRCRSHGVALVQLAATCFVVAVTLRSRHPDFVISSVHRFGLGSHWFS